MATAGISWGAVLSEAKEPTHHLLLQKFGLSILLVAVISLAILSLRNKLKNLNLPPGPRPLPIFGSLRSMNAQEPAHRTFAGLADKYGPLLLMWLGSYPTIVISNAEMAQDFFKNHDQTFASRPNTSAAGKYLGFDFSNVVFSPYGPYYKRLRKIYTLELLSPRRVALSQNLRQIEVSVLLQSVLKDFHAGGEGGPVNLTSKLQAMGIDNLVRMIFSKPNMQDTHQCLSPEQMCELKAVVKLAVEYAGMFYIGDFIPIFGWLDFKGVHWEMKNLQRRMRKIGTELIEKHRTKRTTDAEKLNIIEALLSLKGDDKLSNDAMVAVLFDFIIAGSDTTSVSTEWTIAELLRHPHFFQRAQDELDMVVGKDRLVNESDIQNLPFLQAIVKESFRLHPPAPLGIPHACKEACKVAGYDIPANTTAIVNIWAIGRDPSYWKNPLAFSPDRFMDSDLTMLGRDFQLIPFSVGRRQCPGAQLGLAVVQLAVASLLHSFEWTRCLTSADSIDMTERPGLVTPRATELLVSVKPRLPLHVYRTA